MLSGGCSAGCAEMERRSSKRKRAQREAADGANGDLENRKVRRTADGLNGDVRAQRAAVVEEVDDSPARPENGQQSSGGLDQHRASVLAKVVGAATPELLRRWVLVAAEADAEFAKLVLEEATADMTDDEESAFDTEQRTSEQLFQMVCEGDPEATRTFRAAKDSKRTAKQRFAALIRGKYWLRALNYALAVDRVEQTSVVPLLLARVGRFEEAVSMSKARHATRCSMAVPVFEALVEARQDELAYKLALQFLSAGATQNSRLWRIAEADKNRVCRRVLGLAQGLGHGQAYVSFLLKEASGVRFDELAAAAQELDYPAAAVARLQQKFLTTASSCPPRQLVAICKAVVQLEVSQAEHSLMLVDIFENIARMLPADDSESLLSVCSLLLESCEGEVSNKRLHCFCAFLFVEKLAKGCIEHGIVWEKSSPRAQVMSKAVSRMLVILEETNYDLMLAKRVVKLLAEGHGHNYAILLKWYRRLFNTLSSGVTDFNQLVYCSSPELLQKLENEGLVRVAQTLRISDIDEEDEDALRAAIAQERSRLFNRALCIEFLHIEVTSCRDHLQSMPSSRLVSLRIPSRMVVGYGNFLNVIIGTKALAVTRSVQPALSK